jgi:hypothetical protein
MKKTVLGAAVAALLATAHAQTRSSFLSVQDIVGIDCVISNGGLTYTVTFNPGAYFKYNNVNYFITDLIGVYALSNDDDLTVTNHDIDTFHVDNSNAGPGGIAGWRSNPNQGLTSGQSKVFTFDALSVDRVEQQGFHVRIDGTFPGTDGNTGSITKDVVPEPTTMIGLIAGGAALLARRRRKN